MKGSMNLASSLRYHGITWGGVSAFGPFAFRRLRVHANMASKGVRTCTSASDARSYNRECSPLREPTTLTVSLEKATGRLKILQVVYVS